MHPSWSSVTIVRRSSSAAEDLSPSEAGIGCSSSTSRGSKRPGRPSHPSDDDESDGDGRDIDAAAAAAAAEMGKEE